MSLGNSSGGDSGFVTKLLNSDYGTIIAIAIAVILAGKGIYEFYTAYSGKYTENVEQMEVDADAKSLLIKSGKMGFTARGVVAGIMAFLFFKAGLQDRSKDIDKAQAFEFLQNEFGSIVLGIVAIGIALYGVFMLIKSKYPDTNVN